FARKYSLVRSYPIARRVTGSTFCPSGSSSGTSRSPNKGDAMTHRAEDQLPAAHTKTVARRPRTVPRMPPRKDPIGSVPHAMKRTDAFIRPSNAVGHTAWRYETCAVL